MGGSSLQRANPVGIPGQKKSNGAQPVTRIFAYLRTNNSNVLAEQCGASRLQAGAQLLPFKGTKFSTWVLRIVTINGREDRSRIAFILVTGSNFTQVRC